MLFFYIFNQTNTRPTSTSTLEREKSLYIAAGPNGSGKSTFARQFLKEHDYVFLNADEIAKELNPESIEDVQLTAGRVFISRLFQNLDEGKNILIESTLSGMYLHRILPRIKSRGYRVSIIYVYLEHPRVCIERIKERVLKGGHFVPDNDVVRRFFRSKRNFWKIYRLESDSWFIFFNSNSNFQEVAQGKKDEYIVHNDTFFELYLQDVNV